MDYVYAIIESGGIDYDGALVGYCDTEEEAIQICAEINTGRTPYTDDMVSYVKVKRAMPKVENPTFQYTYYIGVRRSRGGYIFIPHRISERTVNHGGSNVKVVASDSLNDGLCGCVAVDLPKEGMDRIALRVAKDEWCAHIAGELRNDVSDSDDIKVDSAQTKKKIKIAIFEF